MPDFDHSYECTLLQQLRDGDHAAFRTIYSQYKLRLAGGLLRMLKSPGLVEEVLQELFMRLWEHRERIDPSRPIKAYLFAIGENLVRDTFRRVAKDRKMREGMLQAMDEVYWHVEERIVAREIKSELYRVIDMLPPKRREVYKLFKLEAKSYEEIGRELKISTGTVNDHMKKANAFVKNYLANHPEWGIPILLFWMRL